MGLNRVVTMNLNIYTLQTHLSTLCDHLQCGHVCLYILRFIVTTLVEAHNNQLTCHVCHTGEKPYKCDTCQKRFTTKYHLKRHGMIHTGEKPHTCDFCQKRFSRKSNFTRHIMIHSQKPHQCDTCKKLFKEAVDLNSHMRQHTSETPFQCELCEKGFKTKSALKEHRYIHAGVIAPNICHICQKRFATKQRLEKHMNIHKDIHKDNPYICYICKKKFTGSGLKLKLHMKMHTKHTSIYKCDKCGKQFHWKCNLDTHTAKNHRQTAMYYFVQLKLHVCFIHIHVTFSLTINVCCHYTNLFLCYYLILWVCDLANQW